MPIPKSAVSEENEKMIAQVELHDLALGEAATVGAADPDFNYSENDNIPF